MKIPKYYTELNIKIFIELEINFFYFINHLNEIKE